MRIKTSSYMKTITLACVLSLFFSVFNPVLPQVSALSIEEERKMGQEFLAKIRAQFEFVNDPFVNQFFNNLGNYLTKSTETKYFPFHFYIIKDDTLNAFAAPAGQIFFYSGLIDKMDSIDMLAGVLAHEIGHASARHLSQRIEQNKKIGLATIGGILAGMLIGGEAAGALVTGSMAAGVQAQLHYSRNDERQADQLGFKYSTSAGFDPSGLVNALNRIEQERLGETNIPPYLLTHPAGPERMARIDAMVSNFVPGPPEKEVVRLKAQFPVFKTVLKAICLDPYYAEKRFDAELKKTPNSFLPHLGLGIVFMRQSEFTSAIRHFKDALKVKPGFSPALIYLGKAYHMNGQDREAISLLTKALELDRADKSTLFLMGLSYENLEQYEKAIRIFKRLTSLKPVKNEVYYHLGISYGRLNRLALAHYNLGIYSKSLGEMQDAKFHFQKAKDLSRNNPTLRKKILDAMKG